MLSESSEEVIKASSEKADNSTVGTEGIRHVLEQVSEVVRMENVTKRSSSRITKPPIWMKDYVGLNKTASQLDFGV